MMLFAKFLFPFVRFSWSLSLIEFYPCLILFNQYQARYSLLDRNFHTIQIMASPPRHFQSLQQRR